MIYVIIRKIDALEKCRNQDKIDENLYKNKVSNLLSRYNNIIKVIDNFNLEKFINEY